MSQPLMPKATAVWLVDNTSLTFEQIAHFCSLHELEVKGIADGDVAQGIKGMDPIGAGQLTREEIERCQENPQARLQMLESKYTIPAPKTKKGPKYTPLSRRQDRPDAIAWLVRNHPELSDSQISKLVGTTKPTIQSVRDRTHWNSSNIKPVDPVTLGLCTQIELDGAVQKAAKKRERAMKNAKSSEKAGTLLPTDQTIPAPAEPESSLLDPTTPSEPEQPETAADVFGPGPEKPRADEEEQLTAEDVFGPSSPSEDAPDKTE